MGATMGRPELDQVRCMAMTVLGNGISAAGHYEDGLAVELASLSMRRRVGLPEDSILVAQSNLATTYAKMGRVEQAVQMDQDVYYGCLRLFGEEHARTITAAICYANSLAGLERFEEAKALLNKALPVARRVLGESHHLTLRMQLNYVQSLYKDDAATLEDLREAVSTLEETDRIARRVLGGAHPVTKNIEHGLEEARSTLASFDAP